MIYRSIQAPEIWSDIPGPRCLQYAAHDKPRSYKLAQVSPQRLSTEELPQFKWTGAFGLELPHSCTNVQRFSVSLSKVFIHHSFMRAKGMVVKLRETFSEGMHFHTRRRLPTGPLSGAARPNSLKLVSS